MNLVASNSASAAAGRPVAAVLLDSAPDSQFLNWRFP
jgi:hypothetical protein